MDPERSSRRPAVDRRTPQDGTIPAKPPPREPGDAVPGAATLRAPAALLARASTELANALDMDGALGALAAIVVPAAADWYAVDLLDADGEVRRLTVEHRDPAKVERVRQLEERYPRNLEGPRGVGQVIRTGRSELAPRVEPGLLEAVARDDTHLALLRELRLSSYVIVPMIARERTLGAMTFVYAESGRRYDEEARLFLEDLANRAALTLDNIRLIEDLRRAREQLEAQNERLAAQNAELQSQAEELARALGRAEEEHREKEALLTSTADGIYGIDPEGRCTFMNAAAGRLLGLDPGEVRGRNVHRIIHHTRSDGRPYPEEQCPIRRSVREGEAVRVGDEVLWRSDGTAFPAVYTASPMLRDGTVVGAVVAFADETERRAAEGRAQLLGRILDESLNEIYMFDSETLRFVQVNRGGRENLGYSMDELREMTPLDLKPEFTPATFGRLVAPLRTGDQEAVRFETAHLRKDGSTYPVEVNLQLSAAGGSAVFVAVILDITERKKTEEERERLIAELEQANRVKTEFVSTMSHELRTPLNAVLGYTQLMEDGIPVDIPEEAKAQVRRIALSGRHLLQLIDEILTFSKLQAGRESAAPAPVDLGELLEEVRSVLEPLAAGKGLEFHATVEGDRGPFTTDPKKLRQVLLNLTGNAIKFTEQGAVRVVVTRDAGGATFEVRDTGIGMSEEEQAKAFDPFWQADQTATREIGGTGLGLAITRRFVDILGGDIRLVSSAEGTTFTVRLPELAPASDAGAWSGATRDDGRPSPE